MEALTEVIEDPRAAELRSRIQEFSALVGIPEEELAHLTFCEHCGGHDAQWSDACFEDIDPDSIDSSPGEAVQEYRQYLSAAACGPCGGSGFRGGEVYLQSLDGRTLSE